MLEANDLVVEGAELGEEEHRACCRGLLLCRANFFDLGDGAPSSKDSSDERAGPDGFLLERDRVRLALLRRWRLYGRRDDDLEFVRLFFFELERVPRRAYELEWNKRLVRRSYRLF